MKRKKEEKTPILYEKFKQNTEEKTLKYPETKPKKSIFKILGDMLVILILMTMIFLSVIGTMTLVNPVLRNVFMECIYL